VQESIRSFFSFHIILFPIMKAVLAYVTDSRHGRHSVAALPSAAISERFRYVSELAFFHVFTAVQYTFV